MTLAEQVGGRLLVLFDGHCGLCNRSVRWFLRRDRGDRLRFATSESPQVAEVLARHGRGDGRPDTILVVREPGGAGEEVLVRSDAVMAMLRVLARPWPAAAAMIGWIPRPLRDAGYRLIARWRYRVWGRLEVCKMPTAAERERFL